MVPFATACRDAGHEVKVAAPESFANAVAATGLDHAPFADVAPEVLGPIFGRLPELSREEANRIVIGDVFGRLDAQAALPGLTEIVSAWRPDVVVRELCELGSLVAALKAGIPQVEVAIGLAVAADALPILAARLAELDAIAGVAEGMACRVAASVPVLTCVPATLDGDDPTGGGRIKRFRDHSLIAGPGPLPPPWGNPDHPLVYVTFGSVTAGLTPFAGLYRAVLDALAGEPLRILMTVGSAIEPHSLEPWPANAHVEQWCPQADIMAHTAAVVGHGGFGTTMTALAAGVPQVVIPLFASDQFVNAQKVASIGVGAKLDGGLPAVHQLAQALERILSETSYSRLALSLADEISHLPSGRSGPATRSCVGLAGDQLTGRGGPRWRGRDPSRRARFTTPSVMRAPSRPHAVESAASGTESAHRNRARLASTGPSAGASGCGPHRSGHALGMAVAACLTRASTAAAAALLLATGCGSDSTPSTSSTGPPTTAGAAGSVTTPVAPSVTPATQAAPAAPGPVTSAQAGDMALQAVGGGRVTKVEADDQDGRATWKVELVTAAGEKRKVAVDQTTGQVLKNEAGD